MRNVHHPKISIVTPSYNQGSFLQDAIESVIAQQYDGFEHIVIDNCSTDETKIVVGRYPHVRFISEPDHGQSHALNKGFQLVNGDIIGWLNADEIYLPNAFHRIAETFVRCPNLDVVYGDTMHWFLDRNRIGRRRGFAFSHNLLRFWGMYFNTCSTFFSRRFIQDREFIDETYHYHMDHEFVLRLATQGYRFQYIPEVFSAFRVHKGAKTSSARTIELRRLERTRILDHYSAAGLPRILRPAVLTLAERMYAASFGVVRKLTLLTTTKPADEWLQRHAWDLSFHQPTVIPSSG